MRTEPPSGEEMARLLASAKGGLMAEARRSPRRQHPVEWIVGSMVAAVLLIALVTGGALIAFTGAPAPFAGPGPVPTATATNSAPPTTSTPEPDDPAATRAPTPPPTEGADALASVTTIVVRAEGLDFEDAEGDIVTSVSYEDETGLIVGTLTAVLGAEPTATTEGAEEYLAYVWPGVRVSDDLGEGPGRMPTNVMMGFTLPVVGDGVAVTTLRGVSPGDDLTPYAANEPRYAPYPEGIEIIALETGPTLGAPSADGVPNAHAVVASDSAEEDDLSSVVTAPVNLGTGQQFGF